MGAPPHLVLTGVSKAYREGDRSHQVLDRVDLEVDRGELVVLIGKSGSGKSTLLNLLAGIDRPDAGRIAIGGRDLGGLAERELTLFRRRRVGFIFQFFNLLPTLTVEENLMLPLELNGLTDPTHRQRALDLLAEVGLADRLKSFPDRLSGGERQRIAVARALVHDPELLLADEPTGNLDLETGLGVLELLDRLTRRAGKTMVMATHSRRVVGVADRLLAIEGSRIVERAPEADAGGTAAEGPGRPADAGR